MNTDNRYLKMALSIENISLLELEPRPFKQFLWINRGLPGTGGTTLANYVKKFSFVQNYFNEDENSHDLNLDFLIHHYENQMFFDLEPFNGWYDRRYADKARGYCLAQTRRSLEAGNSVIVNNAFYRQIQLKSYLELGSLLGVYVLITSTHGEYASDKRGELREEMTAHYEYVPHEMDLPVGQALFSEVNSLFERRLMMK